MDNNDISMALESTGEITEISAKDSLGDYTVKAA
jgi:hypothetical protein